MSIKKFTPPINQKLGLRIGISESNPRFQKHSKTVQNQDIYSASITNESSLIGDAMDDYTINPLTL